jgi:cytochrome b6-f complex iron-sulfur subunit
MTHQPVYGEVHGPPEGEISRRGFMRRALGIGVGILSLQFLAGTVAFLWPNLRGGLGGVIELGTAADIVQLFPDWAAGQPYSYQQARLFIVNVPAGKELASGGSPNIPDPGADVLALYRKCPHLGCQIPPLCQVSKWFECLCHGSQYNIIGEKRAGPAPRGMDRFAITLNDQGRYVVDTSERISGPPIGTEEFVEPTQPTQHCSG